MEQRRPGAGREVSRAFQRGLGRRARLAGRLMDGHRAGGQRALGRPARGWERVREAPTDTLAHGGGCCRRTGAAGQCTAQGAPSTSGEEILFRSRPPLGLCPGPDARAAGRGRAVLGTGLAVSSAPCSAPGKTGRSQALQARSPRADASCCLDRLGFLSSCHSPLPKGREDIWPSMARARLPGSTKGRFFLWSSEIALALRAESPPGACVGCVFASGRFSRSSCAGIGELTAFCTSSHAGRKGQSPERRSRAMQLQ